jgi:lysophospholipase L1-like esterase
MKRELMRWICLSGLLWSVTGRCESLTAIPPDDPNIKFDGYVNREIVTPGAGAQGKVMRFDRKIDMVGKGYRWDNPGACISFRTDATEIVAVLNYSELHTSTSARNAIGVYSVDGVFKRQWSFRTRQQGVPRTPETLEARISNGGVAGFHQYEIFLPYGDSVDFAGLKVNPEAKFEAVEPKPMPCYVAYGDSITHGFTSTEVSKTYPFLLGEKKGWRVINLGLGGRASTPTDGTLIASLKPDVVTVLMGANDWQIGVPLERYRANMDAFLSNIRSALPETPVYLLTFLWVNSSWNPPGKVADLESYRQVLREVVAARKDPNLFVVEGPALIDEKPSLFDVVPVHPNDAGFAMMAERLEKQIHDLGNKQGTQEGGK